MLKRLNIFKRSKYPNPNPNSSEFEIDNWYLSQLIVEKIVPAVGWHPFPLNELLLMAGAVARFEPKLIFEWGTHIGKSARVFYEVSENLRLKPTIHSIDLPIDAEHIEHPRELRGMLVKGLKRVKLHEGDGIETALALYKNWDKGKHKSNRVLFFIDGDHSYKSVKRELESITKDAPKAAILLHDSFYQSANSKYNVGVNRAIENCLKLEPHKYKRVDTKTGLPGMTLLYTE